MSARVLVVDDEPAILHCISRFLCAAGYETFCATGHKQALEIIADPDRIDLVISDVVMPEMCGPDLVAEIKRRAPNTAAMFISAYPDTFEPGAEVPFLAKPFTRAGLLQEVAEALGRAEPAHGEPGCDANEGAA